MKSHFVVLLLLLVPSTNAESDRDVGKLMEVQCECMKPKLPSPVKEYFEGMTKINRVCLTFKMREALQREFFANPAAQGRLYVDVEMFKEYYNGSSISEYINKCAINGSKLQVPQVARCVVYEMRKDCGGVDIKLYSTASAPTGETEELRTTEYKPKGENGTRLPDEVDNNNDGSEPSVHLYYPEGNLETERKHN